MNSASFTRGPVWLRVRRNCGGFVATVQGRSLTARHPWTRECWHCFYRCINWVSVPVAGGGVGRGGGGHRGEFTWLCVGQRITFFDRPSILKDIHFYIGPSGIVGSASSGSLKRRNVHISRRFARDPIAAQDLSSRNFLSDVINSSTMKPRRANPSLARIVRTGGWGSQRLH